MKLTEKDKEFLDKLRRLVEEKSLSIEKKQAAPSYFVLRGNYGDKIDQAFAMTRQGVRWRFWHIFNRIYISAYETIFFVERNFGSSLRQSAMDISRERFLLREQTRAANAAAGDHHAHKNQD